MWKGTLLHEITHLPQYWRQVAAAPQLNYSLEKVKFGDHARQYFLLARPKVTPRAWIFYWHGGGWQYGTPEQFTATAQSFLAAGYGVVLPSYRRLPRYRFRAIRADTIAMLSACRKQWSDDQEASQKVILLGMSAGGHLATLVGLDASLREAAGWQAERLLGIISCGGVIDFSAMKNNVQVRMLAGAPGSTTFQQANPAAQLDTMAPPILLLHGTKDGMVPYPVAESFLQKYKQRALPGNAELVTLPNGTHLDAARWMFQPEAELHQYVMKRVEDWSDTGFR